MKRLLVASYCVFNVADLIFESLTSIARVVDEVRIYDCRFADYRCHCNREHDNSCDDTVREIEQFSAEYPDHPPVTLRQWPAMGEMVKRSKMMADVPEGDVAFVIDDDELFFGRAEPVREFCDSSAKFAYIDFLFAQAGHGTGAVIPLARLFVRTPGLRYISYYRLEDSQGLVVDMKADNVMIPYGRRQPNRTYIHPSARIVELGAGYRLKKRNMDREAYNKIMGARNWRDGASVVA